MAVAKQFQQLVKITNGTTAETDVKLSDPLAMQHIDITSGANSLNQISLAQSMCQPVAVTPNSTPSGGAYTATCSNYPDFSLTYTDKNGNTHYLVGMKVRVIFTKGITYGSVSGGTYPTLNINSSGAIPLLAQGKTMAAGAAVDGQSLELTLIPYGNGVAWDADSNVRESTSDYTIYTDGKTSQTPISSIARNETRPATAGAVYSFVEWWNLRIKAVTPTSETSETIYANRKISDYKFLYVELGSGNINTRQSLFVPASKITSVTDYSITLYSYLAGVQVSVDITFTSDTTYKIKASSGGVYVGIYGLC